MNIKIVDSWLREFLDTKATPEIIARELSLRSVSVDKVEKINNDFVYDIEVTTNRPDLMSVENIAREAAIALNQESIPAKIKQAEKPKIIEPKNKFPIEIKNNPNLVNRICAVIMEVEIDKSPEFIKNRLELSGIRSLNNLIDVTNYIMRETGHPAHVFDFDQINTKKMLIRESKKGEKIVTLDNKNHTLLGGDIIADDTTGKIIDLLGIMGTANSVVNENTKKIMLFLDNNDPIHIRKTSMNLGIRSEAAIINEKGIDPEIMMATLLKGIELYQKFANGKAISEILDIYPNKTIVNRIKVSHEKINKIIGVEIPSEMSKNILEQLNFKVTKNNNFFEVTTPTIRPDVKIEEDVIEEIARIYGYHKLPSTLPEFTGKLNTDYANNFYFEQRVKNAFKYLGFTETYTYSLISENQFEGPIENAVKLKNPLSSDMTYLRNSIIPSLLEVEKENIKYEKLNIFEIANIYIKRQNDLPFEIATLSGLIKDSNINFFEIKGLIEYVFNDIGINNITFKKSEKGSIGASLYIHNDYLGEIEILDNNIADFEFNFDKILKYANLKKIFIPFAKFPPIIEDISIIIDANINTETIIEIIKKSNKLISDINLIDTYQNSRTFRICYQDPEKNLTKDDAAKIRKDIQLNLKNHFKAEIKE